MPTNRLALTLFAIYALVYTGFVAIIALAPKVMDSTIGGVNLALLYGVGLIVLALALALLYGALSGRRQSQKTGREGGD